MSAIVWLIFVKFSRATVKKLNFKNLRWLMAPILKTIKWIAISLQPYDRFWWNLARWCILAPYSQSTIKTLNFWKSKTVADAILKITKITISQQLKGGPHDPPVRQLFNVKRSQVKVTYNNFMLSSIGYTWEYTTLDPRRSPIKVVQSTGKSGSGIPKCNCFWPPTYRSCDLLHAQPSICIFNGVQWKML